MTLRLDDPDKMRDVADQLEDEVPGVSEELRRMAQALEQDRKAMEQRGWFGLNDARTLRNYGGEDKTHGVS